VKQKWTKKWITFYVIHPERTIKQINKCCDTQTIVSLSQHFNFA